MNSGASDLDVVIIGAGAAGLMCAIEAVHRDRRVLLLDHWSKIGERIRISGGGRCNFTNRSVSGANYLSQNPHFCRSALARFTPGDFVARVERAGIPYEEREHGQLFCTRSAQDITRMLRTECDEVGVRLAAPVAVDRVTHIETPAAGEGPRFSVATDQGTFTCHSLVIATGGLAVPALGATPFGYRVAEQFGLRVIPPRPALVPLALEPDTLQRVAPLSGVAFEAETRCESAARQRFRAGVLITHMGLSGPAILQVSSYWQMQDPAGGPRRPITIDLLPGTAAATWLAEHRRSRALLSTLLSDRLPRRFARAWCDWRGMDAPVADMSNRDIDAAAQALNGWTVEPAGTLGFDKAEVTLGGIDTQQLSSKTMEAAAVPGLYFIGEVVDVTGWLGGYNFQWAWSSGWAAGQFV